MKNYDEIISRFDQIQDLPISEEMLGAYIEGHLSAVENLQVEQQAIYSPDFLTFVKELSDEQIKDLNPEVKLDASYFLADIPILENIKIGFCSIVENLNENNPINNSIERYGYHKKTKK